MIGCFFTVAFIFLEERERERERERDLGARWFICDERSIYMTSEHMMGMGGGLFGWRMQKRCGFPCPPAAASPVDLMKDCNTR
jgi:hypothetical protein